MRDKEFARQLISSLYLGASEGSGEADRVRTLVSMPWQGLGPMACWGR